MLKLFNTNKPIVLFFLPFVAVMLLFPLFLKEEIIANQAPMPLYHLLGSILEIPVLNIFIIFTMIMSGAYLLNQVVNKHNLLFKNTNLAATTYVLLVSIISIYLKAYPVLFANLFLIAAFDTSLSIYNQNKIYSLCFRIGFLIGLASHFYIFSILFFLEFFVALLIIRTFDWRDVVIALLGFIIPFFYSWTYYYWFDELPVYYNAFKELAGYSGEITSMKSWPKITMLIIGALSFYSGIRKVSRENVRQKNLLYLILSYTVLFVLVKIVFGLPLVDMILLLSVPIGILFPILLQSINRRWIAEGFFILTLVASLLNLILLF